MLKNTEQINKFKNAVRIASQNLKTSVTNATEMLAKNTTVLDFKSVENPAIDVQENILLITGVWLPYRNTGIRYMMLDKSLVPCHNEDSLGTRAIVEGSGHVEKCTRAHREVLHIVHGEIVDLLTNKSYSKGEVIKIDHNQPREFQFKNAVALVYWFPPLTELNMTSLMTNFVFIL